MSAADDTITDPVAKQLYELGLEYKKLEEVRSRAFPADGGKVTNDDLSDEEWLRQDRATEDKVPLPDTVLLPEFFALAKKHPTSPFAFDALAFVIRRGGPATGDVEGKPWQIKEQAIDLMLENHMDDPRIAHVFDILDGSLPSRKTEAFLRHAIENGSEPITRAAASVGLARYFHTFATVHKRSRQLKGKVRLLNYERFWNIVITPYLEEEFPYDQEQVSAEIERLLIQVIEEYRDIMAIDWKVSGPSKVFISTEAFVEPKTYGEMARSLMFELNSLVPGKKAPDIEGTDAEGKKFRLSDYEGKVVLLTFSANWCGGCVKLYPLQRNLVDKFRNEPFVLLSVSLDESVETLQASTTSGEITWRCWWDGENGPISKAWNRHGVPSLVLLDHQHVIQDVLLNRYTLQEDFENEIETLIAKISPKKAVSQ
ncbi:MAG: TlpA family protein disulfide reductase [Pirellulales bacterium]|nr:TlpA family protein disulfide reductase [Pirellulales bacterium]